MLVHEAITSRWSPRAFSDKQVENRLVFSLIEAARWAPSSMNEQPWRFIVGDKKAGDEYEKVLESLVEGNKVWAKDAPVLIVVVAKMFFDYKHKPNNHAWYDTGQAMGNFSLRATELGLVAHQMGGFSKEKIKESFDLDDEYEPIAVVALGYMGDLEQLPENLREREMAERKRIPIEELILTEYKSES